MDNEQSTFSRVATVVFGAAIGVFILAYEATLMATLITAGSLDSLVVPIGRHGHSFGVVTGYKALLTHGAYFIIGVFCVLASIEQIKVLKEKWS